MLPSWTAVGVPTFVTARTAFLVTGNVDVPVLVSVSVSVPKPLIVAVFVIDAGEPVPTVSGSTLATMVIVRCVVALATSVPIVTVKLSGLAPVVSWAEAGITIVSPTVLDVALRIWIPSGISSVITTPVAGPGPSFLAVTV